MKKKYSLGMIELGTEVYVSDPCYSVGTWCQTLVGGLKPGKYQCFMSKKDFGEGGLGDIRVTDLWIAHEDNVKCFPSIRGKDSIIGVDSGAAGIYDKEYFEKYHTFESGKHIDDYPEASKWYDKQFDLRYYYDIEGQKIKYGDKDVERRNGISLDNKCVISFSGFGDGGYPLYEARNSKGEIVGLRIKFI